MTQSTFSQKEAHSSVLPLCILFWTYTNLKTQGKNTQEDHSFFSFSAHLYTILKILLLCYLTKVMNFSVGYLWYPCFSLQDKYSWKLIVNSLESRSCHCFSQIGIWILPPVLLIALLLKALLALGISDWWLSMCHMELLDWVCLNTWKVFRPEFLLYSKHVNRHWNRTWISIYFFVSGFYCSLCT